MVTVFLVSVLLWLLQQTQQQRLRYSVYVTGSPTMKNILYCSRLRLHWNAHYLSSTAPFLQGIASGDFSLLH